MKKRALLSWLALAALVVIALPPGRSLHVLAASGPKAIPGTIPSAVTSGQAQLIGPHRSDDTIGLALALALPNRAGLQRFLQALSDPSSAQYRRPLSLDQANAQFDPTSDQERMVTGWLTAHGLTVTRTYPNHLLVDVSATVGQIDRLLHITLEDYRISINGVEHRFFAPNTDPVLDASVAGAVDTVVGLDSFPRFHMASNGSAHGYPPYYPQDFANAYDVNPLWNAGADGTGQHIGITLWTVPPSDATLAQFASHTGANVARTGNGRLNVISVDGGTTATVSPDQGEAGMDIETASGLAPGAVIDYYEAPTDAFGNATGQGLLDALSLAATDATGNTQITNSWGECEYPNDAWTQAAENIFAANQARGISYFFSSGDNGSWCEPYNPPGQDPYPDYPASSPNVTSVGGTRFNGLINGAYPGESAWAYCSTCNSGEPEGSGGGYSNIFSRPSWQVGPGLANNGMRGYPDVAADADPNTGAYVCFGNTPNCNYLFGGTSLASPLWAGINADINSYLAQQGQPPVGFLAPLLYNLANSNPPYSEFHDVTSGTNGGYNAGPNWDAVTGWGSMDAYNLARDIAANGGGGGGGGTPTSTPTDTPTGTPAPTDTPTNTPTNTPTPTGQQLLSNGGFESGQAPWTETAYPPKQLIATVRAHSGSHSVYFCGTNTCSDQLWQTISIPSSYSSLTVSYWYYVTSQETAPACYDAFHSRIRTTTGVVLGTLQTLCNSNKTSGWVQKTVDVSSLLSAYKGRQVQVYFNATTNATNPSAFYLDDVTLTAM